ncbi:MAG: hypothetical protein Q8916_04000 [Bacteroidota bacterium]|nr:hypothetical protein [Bacteroidota bacterium]MDP4229551.1 hypothetical protein [Bacteroidota bacterium]MDP4235112.1 hypothetical protein [Bacteroidota bacterium]
MKATILFAVLFVLSSCAASNPTRTELLQMEKIDQEPRNQASAEGMDSVSKDTALWHRMAFVDSTNTKRLRELLGSAAWFTKEEVGSAGLSAAFIIVQHSPDYEFMKRCLPYIEKQARSGDLDMQQYAMLLDRTLMHDNKPQVYGTQFEQVNGELVPYKIEDEANLDKRRAEAGLMPMKAYKDLLNQVYPQSGKKEK